MKRQQVVLITGATRGIGKAAALRIARRGHQVIATGRNEDLLEALKDEANEGALPLQTARLDVNDADGMRESVAKVIKDHSRLDAVVNNAGYGLWGCLEELEADEVRSLFETNVVAPLRLSQMALPHMRRQGFGTIVNVGSVAGQIATPLEGAYSASKFALRALSRAMRIEVASFGVRVVLIEPGVIRTDFQENKVTGRNVLGDGSPYLTFTRDSTLRARARAMVAAGPGPVAARVLQVIEGRSLRPCYAVGLDARAGILASRFLPEAVLDFLLRRAIVGPRGGDADRRPEHAGRPPGR